MARKTQIITFRERIRAWRSSRTKRSTARNWDWVALAKIAVVAGFLTASGAFLRYAEGYVASIHPAAEGSLVLVGVPPWVNWDLQARVGQVAGGRRFPLTEETASVLARNLASLAWLTDISIQVAHDSVRVKARWRKPVASIHVPEDSATIYVDPNLVVLDYMPMPHLPIVEINNVGLGVVPLPGQVFDQQDLAAAIALILLLQRMDAEWTPKNPLLEHIASIDVRNFNGRKNRRSPHLVLHSKEGTEIRWGAELDQWAKYLEATDEDKLTKLYGYYYTCGSLSAGAKYINLCDPQDKIPMPIDKYRR